MGLGIEVDAARPAGATAEALVERIARACLERVADPLLRELVVIGRGEDELTVGIHPATEPIVFRFGEERVTCSARTSPAGPGYHAFVVELVEGVGDGLGLAWRWGDETSEAGDEGEFHETRDFGLVQAHMLSWLADLCGHVVRADACEPIHVSLPLGFGAKGAGVLGPLGPIDLAWAQAVAAATPATLADLGPRFFAWWDRSLDAEFWRRYALAVAWVDVPWHAPATPEEERAYDAALAAFERCRELDPALVLPDLDVAELRRLRAATPEAHLTPRPTGIGYRRGAWRWPLPGGWSVDAPGYWYDETDEGEITLSFGDRAIIATAYRVMGTPEDFLSEESWDTPVLRTVEWQDGSLRARGEVVADKGSYLLHGRVFTDGALLSTTIVFAERDAAWAEETFRSIRRPHA